ncbi:uncharacterized protein LOC125371703 [Haliotis rufescens]|uniref:uncharacterized protein LOC125371703 n=1 Tax=Haliotis rufescens TaxID=6454 RepID=UPI00201EDAB3|nr:uncharacterized protein LOC125371703 [Haliotis rufescens]
MWKMMTLSFLMCFFTATLIRVQDAADADVACAACTTAYKSDTDMDCPNLKEYLNCLENAAGTTDWCTLSTEDAQKVTKATCKTTLGAPCTCLKDFWGSECRSLEHYTDCLNTAHDAACGSGDTASKLITRATGRSHPKCSSGASPLRMYSAIASFLPFVLAAFRL